MRTALFFLVGAIFASPLAAQEGEYDGWEVGNSGERCHLMSGFGDSSDPYYLRVDYWAQEKEVVLSVILKNGTSLTHEQELNMGIVFVDGREIDDAWGDTEFTAMVTPDFQQLISQPLTTEFLDDFAEAHSLGFLKEGAISDIYNYEDRDLLFAFQLKGSARAIQALRVCSIRASGLNTRDPFLDLDD